MKTFRSIVLAEAAKIACLKCDEVSTEKAWQKNNGTCPKCKKSTQGVAESLDENASRVAAVNKEYAQLKTQSIKELRNELGRIHRVVNVKEYDKAGAISDILRNKFGDRSVDLAMKTNFKEEMSPDALTIMQDVGADLKKLKSELQHSDEGKETWKARLMKIAQTIQDGVSPENEAPTAKPKAEKKPAPKVNKKPEMKESLSEGSSNDYTPGMRARRSKERNAGEDSRKSQKNTATYELYVDGTPLKIKGEKVTGKVDTLKKTANTLMAKSFNKGKKFELRKISESVESLEEGSNKRTSFDKAIDRLAMIIKAGQGWINPEYVEAVWDNENSDYGKLIDFKYVARPVYEFLIAKRLLSFPGEENEYGGFEEGKQVTNISQIKKLITY